jgi:hypothetical protein
MLFRQRRRFRELVDALDVRPEHTLFQTPLRPPAVPRYHLPLAASEHGAFARKMPQYLHFADISTTVNKVSSDADYA